MPEIKNEFIKTPDNAKWQKILESISQKRFLIYTSNPVLQQHNWAEYKKDSSAGVRLDLDTRDIEKKFNDENHFIRQEGFSKSPEIIFFRGNRLVYNINPGKFFDVITKGEIFEHQNTLSEDQKILFDIACWRDIHSGRSGNSLELIVDLEDESLTRELKSEIAQNPFNARKILEKLVLERMDDLKNKWIGYNYQDLKTNLRPNSDIVFGSLRPPYEALEKLGYSSIGVMSDDSTKENPRFEYFEYIDLPKTEPK